MVISARVLPMHSVRSRSARPAPMISSSCSPRYMDTIKTQHLEPRAEHRLIPRSRPSVCPRYRRPLPPCRPRGGWVAVGSQWGGRRATRLTALVLSTYGNICHLCGGRGATTADHIVPRSHGGDDSIDNMRPAHGRCNSKRGNMSLDEWRSRYGATQRAGSRSW